ncbi:unnamed protein product, partial [Rotaria magnacalcarata]
MSNSRVRRGFSLASGS